MHGWVNEFFVWWNAYAWPFFNSNFFSGAFPALVGILLARRVAEVADSNKTSDAVRSAQAQVSAIDRDDGDVLHLDIPVPEAEAPNNAQAGLVRQLEAKIDQIKVAIENTIQHLDGRRRRKYQNIARYDYRPLILLLARDGAIDEAKAYSLVDLITVWRAHRRKKHLLPPDKAEALLAFQW